MKLPLLQGSNEFSPYRSSSNTPFPRRVHPRTLTFTRTCQYICIRSVITFSTR